MLKLPLWTALVILTALLACGGQTPTPGGAVATVQPPWKLQHQRPVQRHRRQSRQIPHCRSRQRPLDPVPRPHRYQPTPRHRRRQILRHRLLRQPPRFQRRHPRRLTPTPTPAFTSTKEQSTATSIQPRQNAWGSSQSNRRCGEMTQTKFK